MDKTMTIKSARFVALTITLPAVVAMVVLSTLRVKAEPDNGPPSGLQQLSLQGFRASSSSPFLLQGNLGQGVWQRLVGPILGTTFGIIPAAANFGGAGCQPEYSQDQITVQDGSSLLLNVVGFRCVQSAPAGASTTTGVYDITSGTGRFAKAIGAGTVTIDERADGSAFIIIGGVRCFATSSVFCFPVGPPNSPAIR